MFNIFKSTIHEPEALQLKELQSSPARAFAILGLNCDELPTGSGLFGQNLNNPIPVNGTIGTFKYINKLVCPTGGSVYFHRLGSLKSNVTEHLIDAYEVVSWEGDFWDILFISFYHPRRSNKAPDGYKLVSYKNHKLGDTMLCFGTNSFCPAFPHDLPPALIRHFGNDSIGLGMKDGLEKNLKGKIFKRPEKHLIKYLAALALIKINK